LKKLYPGRIVIGIFITVLLISHLRVLSQDFSENHDSYCDPTVNGLARPIGISFEYEKILNYNITSHSNVDGYPDGEGAVNSNRRIKLKFKVPVINKDHFKFAMGFRYSHEEFRFESPNELDYLFYQNLENKPLRSIGSDFYFMLPRKNNTFFALALNLSINGDYFQKSTSFFDYLKVSVAPVFGIKKHENLIYGFGFAYSYVFGDPSITPVITYMHTFNKKWGIEAILPFEAKVRYNINPGSFLYAGAKIRGASYQVHLDDAILDDIRMVELRNSEMKLFVSLRQEISDFLWFSVNAGYRYNINFNIADSNHNRSATNFFGREYLLESNLDNAFFFNVSLDIVPPRKWYNKKK